MLIAVEPNKISFSEMQFISVRFPAGMLKPVLGEALIDDLFDAVSAEIANVFGISTVETLTI